MTATREAADVRTADVMGLFCCQVRKWIDSFAAISGERDTLVFTMDR